VQFDDIHLFVLPRLFQVFPESLVNFYGVSEMFFGQMLNIATSFFYYFLVDSNFFLSVIL